MGQFCQSIGIERGDQQKVRPFAEFDVQYRLTALIKPARPFVRIA